MEEKRRGAKKEDCNAVRNLKLQEIFKKTWIGNVWQEIETKIRL